MCYALYAQGVPKLKTDILRIIFWDQLLEEKLVFEKFQAGILLKLKKITTFRLEKKNPSSKQILKKIVANSTVKMINSVMSLLGVSPSEDVR